MTTLADHHEITVTEATRRGVAGLVADAENGETLVVTRRQKPVAAVVGMRRLTDIDDAAAEVIDLALAVGRAATDSGRRTSIDDVLAAYGHTRESLDALGEDDD